MSDISTKLYGSIDEIMERFDFEKVRRVMEFLNWTWAGVGIPSTEELKSTARRVLYDAVAEYERLGYPDTGMDCATGGFIANISKFSSGGRELSLAFYVHQEYVSFR